MSATATSHPVPVTTHGASRAAGASKSEERSAFGGPLGALVMLIFMPAITVYLWICVHRHGGSLVLPTSIAVSELPFPNTQAAILLAGWFVFQLVLDVVLPGRAWTGPVQKDGKRRTYRLNGFLSLVVSLAALATIFATGIGSGRHVVELLGPLLICSILLSYAFSAFLHVYGRNIEPDEALSRDSKPGLPESIYDYFMGTSLNPRVGNVDLKMFMESKIGMTTWLVLTLSMAHAEYQLTGSISPAMALVSLFQAVYTLDFFWFEEAMLTTWDINQENYGFMLAFAFLVWMPFNFSLQSQYLVYADPELSWTAIFALLALNFAGYFIFRTANLQKHYFRTVPGTKIWGKEPDFIQTARGTKLLASGWWSIARHCNYLGDLMMALAWCLTCGTGHIVPYFYFLYFAPLLIDRERRDDRHCAEKYGNDWERYRQRVPYRIVPFIY